MWQCIWQFINTPIIVALIPTLGLPAVVWLWRWWDGRKQAAAIRDIIHRYRPLVLTADSLVIKPEDSPGPASTISADEWRAARYNHMIGELRPIVDNWPATLSPKFRDSLLRALDWFHTDEGPSLIRNEKTGAHEFVPAYRFVPGSWPTADMSLHAAKKRFRELDRVRWLK